MKKWTTENFEKTYEDVGQKINESERRSNAFAASQAKNSGSPHIIY